MAFDSDSSFYHHHSPRSMGLFAAKKGFQQTMTKKVESLESLVSALATQNQEVS
jgi:hypothetical protein